MKKKLLKPVKPLVKKLPSGKLSVRIVCFVEFIASINRFMLIRMRMGRVESRNDIMIVMLQSMMLQFTRGPLMKSYAGRSNDIVVVIPKHIACAIVLIIAQEENRDIIELKAALLNNL